ncbi:hypothetical protein LX36DRAFT_649911 [Colletotrichum falcatum]|nr:hypothetical protein LX36DRAFT_649911 [Colletotrichum falcatum]
MRPPAAVGQVCPSCGLGVCFRIALQQNPPSTSHNTTKCLGTAVRGLKALMLELHRNSARVSLPNPVPSSRCKGPVSQQQARMTAQLVLSRATVRAVPHSSMSPGANQPTNQPTFESSYLEAAGRRGIMCSRTA